MRPKPAEALLAGLVPFLFGIPWTIFNIIFLFMMIEAGVQDQKQYNNLTSEGVTAQAVITKLEIDDSDDSTTHFVYFRFTAPPAARKIDTYNPFAFTYSRTSVL